MAIIEIAVRTIPSQSGLTQPGDIIAARKPHTGVGRKSRQDFLWMWIDVDDLIAVQLLSPSDDGRFKRRYYIPLDRLKMRVPDLDMGRATDPREVYQPFVGLSHEGERTKIPEAIKASDLIIDKITRNPIRGFI